jgi:hypothetical protein
MLLVCTLLSLASLAPVTAPLVSPNLGPHPVLGCDGEIVRALVGQSPADRFGAALAGGVDVDLDGFGDVLVGAPRGSLDRLTSAGVVSVFAGSDGTLLYRIGGQSRGDTFGAALAVVADLNGDGRREFLVGSPYGGGGFGRVSVHSGADGVEVLSVIGSEDGSEFGTAIAGLGDVNGDGCEDFAVGAPTQDSAGLLAGRVEAFSGLDGTRLWMQDGVQGDLLGRSLASAGDLDGDGLGDLIAGAPFADSGGFNSGSAYVFSGVNGDLILSLKGTESGAQLGDRVALVGDVDLDGVADILLGAPGADAAGIDSGLAEVRSGVDGSTLLAIPGEGSAHYLQAVAAAGDFDYDGVADFAVGEALGGKQGFQRGVVRVISGHTGRVLQRIEGDVDAGWLGASLATAGDVDGDGHLDLCLGAPVSDDEVLRPGSVLILHGGCDPSGLHNRVPRKR